MQVSILGRQPKISISELESLFSSDKVRQVGMNAAVINTSEPLPQLRLGGTIKSGSVIATLKNKNIEKAYEYIENNIVDLTTKYVPEGKIQFGISMYGFRLPKRSMFAKNLEIKKILKSANRSIRLIENKSEALETAQVLHNKLATSKGLEILIIKDNDDVIIARTTGVQDIDAYARRDQGRPMRDAKVGMLPPKLAQIIINLATGPIEKDKITSMNILDPFCGTGVLLQEASLLGFNIFGTDLEERMIDYTHKNLIWLSKNPNSSIHNSTDEEIMSNLEVGDATKFNWGSLLDINSSVAIACESYLGKPLSTLPSKSVLDNIIKECEQLHDKFFENIGKQIQSGTRLCVAVPAWKTKNGFIHLNTLDHLDKLGYNRMSFVHVRDLDLIYHRPDQTVARELVVLQKK